MEYEKSTFIPRTKVHNFSCVQAGLYKKMTAVAIGRDRQQGGTRYRHTRHQLKHRKRSVDLRPETVNTKERFGDRETDTVAGKNNKGAIVTAVERKTAFMMMERLEHGKNAKQLSKAAVRLLTAHMKNVHAVTGDSGTEFADRQSVAKSLKTGFFFTRPFSSREKGLIENTNKLIRQYIPEQANFNDFNEQQI